MTLIIKPPLRVSAKNIIIKAASLSFDPDALAYISAVEVADGQSLETAVKNAINAFVVGCKSDGTWNAIKASCLMAGARTLAGALVPLVGPAPTNVGFLVPDYNRRTGVQANGGDGGKYIDSNRANNADATTNSHRLVYATSGSSGSFYGSNVTTIGPDALDIYNGNLRACSRSAVQTVTPFTFTAGTYGVSRSATSSYQVKYPGDLKTMTAEGGTNDSTTVLIFKRRTNATGGTDFGGNYRLSFYSIGEAIDLALLDARVTALMNTFATIIP